MGVEPIGLCILVGRMQKVLLSESPRRLPATFYAHGQNFYSYRW